MATRTHSRATARVAKTAVKAPRRKTPRPAARRTAARAPAKPPAHRASTSKPGAKGAKATVRRDTSRVKASPVTRIGKSTATRGSGIWSQTYKAYGELFGPTQPSGRILNADGTPHPLAESAGKLGVFQFPPAPDRMSWLYITCGLSILPPPGHTKALTIELGLHWRLRDGKAAARVLGQIATHLHQQSVRLAAGDVIASDQDTPVAVDGLAHWLAAAPDRAIPAHARLPVGNTHFLLLLGVTDDEFQFAMKVRPELADGRKVLLEALKIGGVFPVSDPGRACLTRRRDFHRIWETAFRTVRERTAPAVVAQP